MIEPAMDTSETLETAACPLGCVVDYEPLFETRDQTYPHLPGIFGVVRCRGCGLIRTTPRPRRAAIGRYYPADYVPYHADDETQPFQLEGRGRIAHKWSALANGIWFPAMQPGRVLEIGCAHGRVLDRLRAVGWHTSGIEFNSAVAAEAREKGHAILTGDVETVPTPPAAPFDLVIGQHVIEHLYDPVVALRRLASWTHPEGWLSVTVPDARALGWRLLGAHWQPVDLPRHLFHFTPATLGTVLARAGWQLVRCWPQTSAVFMFASLANCFRQRGDRRLSDLCADVAANRRLRTLRRILGVALGAVRQTGSMIVWARRSV
jgi:SAM-dependent methyltransferase